LSTHVIKEFHITFRLNKVENKDNVFDIQDLIIKSLITDSTNLKRIKQKFSVNFVSSDYDTQNPKFKSGLPGYLINKPVLFKENRDATQVLVGIQIQGAHMLSKKGGNDIVITKSLKDVMVLYQYGIPAIAPCSENIFITDSQYERLKKKYKNVYLFYDNDETGIKSMCKIKREHEDLRILFLPRHGGDKDISDYRKAHGDKKTRELINKVKLYYDEKDKERSESGE
jgi:hypothetical protein